MKNFQRHDICLAALFTGKPANGAELNSKGSVNDYSNQTSGSGNSNNRFRII